MEGTLFTGPPGTRPGRWCPAWAPDGRRLALVSSSRVTVFDTQQGLMLGVHRLPQPVATEYAESPVNNYRRSPDGRRILICWERAVVLGVATGVVERIFGSAVIAEWAADEGGLAVVAISPTGPDPGAEHVAGE